MTDKNGEFTITSAEYKAMNDSNDNTEYVIHSYFINDGTVESFNIYGFDKETQLLVDLVNKSKVCALQSRVLNNEGISTTIYDCIPTKRKNITI